MAETVTRKYNPHFVKKASMLFKVSEGYVLVKRNDIFKGRIRAIVKKREYPETEPDVRVVHIHDPKEVSDELLQKLKKQKDPNSVMGKMIEQEIAYREGRAKETPELLSYAFRLRGTRTVMRKKIEAKTGLRIKWPWESAIVLSLAEIEVQTAAIPVDTKDKVHVLFDTDYRYKIVDPHAYALLISQKGNAANVERLMGRDLDQLVIDYVKKAGIDEFIGKSSPDLMDVFGDQLAAIGEQYGVEITRFLVGKVTWPKEITEAEAAKRAAVSKAEADRIRAQGRADARRLENAAELEKKQAEADIDVGKASGLSQVRSQTIADTTRVVESGATFKHLAPQHQASVLGSAYGATAEGPKVIVNGTGAVADQVGAAVAAAKISSTDGQEKPSKKEEVSGEDISTARQLCEEEGVLSRNGYFDPETSQELAAQFDFQLQEGMSLKFDQVPPEVVVAFVKERHKTKTKSGGEN